MKIETLAVHAGHHIEAGSGAVSASITLSTTFERAADGTFPGGYIYTRTDNPNRAALEECIAALEGGAKAAAFSSGTAAAMAVIQALGADSHVIAPNDCYHGTRALLRNVFGPWKLESTFVDMTDLDAVQQAIRPNTRLILVETPSNPLLMITNLARVAEIAHKAGAIVACDNTWATPILQRPFAFGADLVIHSTTKYFGGHSDVLGGAVISHHETDFFERVSLIQKQGGAVPSPFDCWLVLRGIRSLPYRIRAHSENAAKVAAFLHQHPRVEATYYPGLPDHPNHDVAAEQMSMFGGMLSFQVRGGRDQAFRVVANVSLFTPATSLGGTESLIEHRQSVEGPDTTTPDNLLRVSVGLEHPDDLIADLAQALG
jgi:cystathionine gamma-synthase